MNSSSFQRIFTDNSSYATYKQVAYVEPLAYMVQNFLYSPRVNDRNYYFQIEDRIKLYNFMTLVVYIIPHSTTVFGKATIKGYLEDIKDSQFSGFLSDKFEYTEDGRMTVTYASFELVEGLLWAAYVYCLVRYDLEHGNDWNEAAEKLYDLMCEEGDFDKKGFRETSLMKCTREAKETMVEYIAKTKSKSEQNTQKNEGELSGSNTMNDNENNARCEDLQQRIAELNEENERLKAEIEQLRGNASTEIVESYDALKSEIDRINTLHEDTLVELLKPAFYGIETDARSFLRKIYGLDSLEVTGIVKQFISDRKIMDSKKGRFIWSILHAAKLYDRVEQNWTHALKK